MNTQTLVLLVDQKFDLLLQLRRLGQLQVDAIVSDGWDELLKVLAAKQRLLDILQTIEKKLDPFRDENPDSRQWSSQEARQSCRQKINQCDAMLHELMEAERRSESDLVHRRDVTAAKLQSVQQAHIARSAYEQSGKATSTGLDLSSGG